MQKPSEVFGLVLTGGGARGAYQVGVLKAMAKIAGHHQSVFQVITGVSVGALNAAGLASHFESLEHAAGKLEDFWSSLQTQKVFDSRFSRLAFTGMRLLFSEFLPRLLRNPPNSLLDNCPLRRSMSENIDFDKISDHVQSGPLKAVGITCSGYTSGHAVTFFESGDPILEWHRARRDGCSRKITLDHVMSSSALPLLFPAVKIRNEFFGDGALRLTSPLAPAIHLGATRLFVIGTRDKRHDEAPNNDEPEYPSVSDLGGYALDTIFHDNLEADIERLERINNLIGRCPPHIQRTSPLKHIKLMTLYPQKALRDVALQHMAEMPRGLHWIIRRQASKEARGRLESYLLFEPGYINALIEMGYADTMAIQDELIEFLAS